MSAPHHPPGAPIDPEEAKRPHTYDGIEEYDKRLPNWWLFTLYGAIVFSIAYWAATIKTDFVPTNEVEVTAAMARIEAAKLADAPTIDDPTLWRMSRNEVVIASGKTVYATNCAACHLPSLRGKSESPAAIGPDLTDAEWIHGGTPLQLYHVVDAGVLEKGMPPWGPVLGAKQVSAAVAYILSKHPAPSQP